jgi:hypothetical protein
VILGYLGANYWLIEVFVGLFAVLSIFIVWSGEKTLEDHLETTDEAEEAVKEGY